LVYHDIHEVQRIKTKLNNCARMARREASLACL